MENEQPQLTPQPDLSELNAKLDSLQRSVLWVLLLLTIVTFAFAIVLLRQVKTKGTDLVEIGPAATNAISLYQKNVPAMNDLIKKFQDFGRTNPDFMPVLARRGLKPGTDVSLAPTSRPPSTTSPTKK